MLNTVQDQARMSAQDPARTSARRFKIRREHGTSRRPWESITRLLQGSSFIVPIEPSSVPESGMIFKACNLMVYDTTSQNSKFDLNIRSFEVIVDIYISTRLFSWLFFAPPPLPHSMAGYNSTYLAPLMRPRGVPGSSTTTGITTKSTYSLSR